MVENIAKEKENALYLYFLLLSQNFNKNSFSWSFISPLATKTLIWILFHGHLKRTMCHKDLNTVWDFIKFSIRTATTIRRHNSLGPGGSVVSVSLMTWWLWVWSPVEANFLSGAFSPLTSAEASEKVVGGFVKMVWESQETHVRHWP